MADTAPLGSAALRFGALTPNVIVSSDQKQHAQSNHNQHPATLHLERIPDHAASFYTQFDTLPPSFSPNDPQNPSHYLGTSAAAPHRLDMSSVGNALPDGVQSQPSPIYQNPNAGYNAQFSHPQGPYGMRSQMSPMSHFAPSPFRQQSSGSFDSPNSLPRLANGNQMYQQSHYAQISPYPAFVSQYYMSTEMPRIGTMPPSYPPAYASMSGMPQTQMAHFPGSQYSASANGVSPGPDFGGQNGAAAYARRLSESGPTPSYPRGPPRKPKQSGHALWVGNLPPGTDVMHLKDHFSRDATKEIESLFLISKSNCAFVNYRTEAACSAAMTRFHDSRFQGVRLVCRLRRRSGAGGTSQVTSSTATNMSKVDSPTRDLDDCDLKPKTEDHTDNVQLSPDKESFASEIIDKTPSPAGDKVAEKYFIVKSLTMQDLDASVKNGIWATQSHNEETLNAAFKQAKNVFLIFSANKSGEYFGYARMKSSIQARSSPAPGTSSSIMSEPTDITDGPKSIPTPATEWAPQGHIIDDSARGTIFWEADPLEDIEADGVQAAASSFTSQRSESQDSATSSSSSAPSGGQDWGKPFQIEWISTNRLPFYRTRGLRNPWNANREVKIARDGTELELSVGKRLVQMFHRPGPQVVVGGNMPMINGAAVVHSPMEQAAMYGVRY